MARHLAIVIATLLAGCAASARPCPSSLPTEALHRADYPEDAITFSTSGLPGARGLGAVTFALYLRADRESPPYAAGTRPIGMSFQTSRVNETPSRCDDVALYVDGHRIASHVEDASTVEVTPHDDGISMASVRFDGRFDASAASCVEIVACGVGYALPLGTGAELARLLEAM